MTPRPLRRRGWRGAALALAPLVALGCGCERSSDPARVFAASGTRARPEVVLLHPGSGELRTLRLRPRPGDEQTLVVDAENTFSSTLADRPGPSAQMPTTRQRVRLRVQELGPEGAIVLGLGAFGLELEPRESDPAATREALEQANRATARVLEAAHGEALLHEQGFVERVSLEVPLGGDAAGGIAPEDGERFAKQLQGSFLGALDGALPALPREPVGAGARWRVTQEGEKEGRRTQEEVEYEIVALDERGLDLAFRFSSSAPPQPISLPGGEQAEVTGMSGRGEGKLRLDLARALPSAGSMSSTATWELESRGEGESRRMTASEAVALEFRTE